MRGPAALIALTCAAVVATPSLAHAAPHDRVTGRGVSSAEYEARVNALSGAAGESPRGSFSVDFLVPGASDEKVQVSCLVVVGDTAIVGGLDREGQETFLTVQDNGETGDLLGHAVGVVGGNAPDQARCAAVLAAALLLPVTGDFTVVDA